MQVCRKATDVSEEYIAYVYREEVNMDTILPPER
jgi:hypothetical protein